MPDSYSLLPRKARICRIVGRVFLIAALLWAMALIAQAALPGWTISCEAERGCVQASGTTVLLPERARSSMRRKHVALKEVAAYASQPMIRLGLALLVVIREGPMVFLLLAIGAALLRLGRVGRQVLAGALPWLRRGALAGLIWAITQPFADAGRAILLFPAMPAAGRYIPLDLTIAGPALLLAVAAYAVAWALDAGVQAERDLATFV
jgi:hypothetical protein